MRRRVICDYFMLSVFIFLIADEESNKAFGANPLETVSTMINTPGMSAPPKQKAPPTTTPKPPPPKTTEKPPQKKTRKPPPPTTTAKTTPTTSTEEVKKTSPRVAATTYDNTLSLQHSNVSMGNDTISRLGIQNNCSGHQDCGIHNITNHNGECLCACLNGYKKTGLSCTDVNECESKKPCNGRRCVNTLGSFKCEDSGKEEWYETAAKYLGFILLAVGGTVAFGYGCIYCLNSLSERAEKQKLLLAAEKIKDAEEEIVTEEFKECEEENDGDNEGDIIWEHEGQDEENNKRDIDEDIQGQTDGDVENNLYRKKKSFAEAAKYMIVAEKVLK